MNIQKTSESLEQQVDDLLSQMSLREKVLLLSGKNTWYTNPIPRLGIGSLAMTDGPHGVRADRDDSGRPSGPATTFPTGISMAATWDPELVECIGEALAEETLALGCDILLGPCVNIVRSPLGGRNFETYSEDPYLAGRTGVAWVRGLQRRNVGASLKHFAANNQETERFRANSQIDERTLREIYLPAFEAVVKETHPWTVMCSYNRLNGEYASQNRRLLREILKEEWGFDGLVVSDWGANHTTVESVAGGLDLEMPGPEKYYGDLLVQAVYNWQIDPIWIDDAVRRILRILGRAGKLQENQEKVSYEVNTPEHQVLARRVAEEAITLLKNESQVLPLDLSKIKSLAVLGPNAAKFCISGGGSSYAHPPYQVSPLEGLRKLLGDQVQIAYEQGCDNFDDPVELPLEWLELPDGSGAGLRGEYFDNPELGGAPLVVQTDRKLDFWEWRGSPVKEITDLGWSARWTAQLRVPATGTYKIRLSNSSLCRIYLDGKLLFENHAPDNERADNSVERLLTQHDLAAGKVYALKVEYFHTASQPFSHAKLTAAQVFEPGQDPRLKRAVELARQAEAAMVFVGMPELYESEGYDRPDMDLPGGQDELVRAVAGANPNTIVVVNAGSPVTMPWVDEVPALVWMYYPGLEGGNAIARVLIGEVVPSGKLPISLPRRLEDNPAYLNAAYPGSRNVNYAEGIFVGYRYYDQKGVEPLFPFGHGLSYTTFEYSHLQVPEQTTLDEPVDVSITIKNTGSRTSKEAVQLYVRDISASLPRPPKELKGFQKVVLRPGESQTLHFVLDRRAFAFYDPIKEDWFVEPGEFEILVGSSSRDIRVRQAISYQLSAAS